MENGKSKQRKITWWQLSLLGVGSIIGTGYFLASSIAIQKAGPSVLIMFVLAALGTYIVYDALATMTASQPKQGSFRSYAKQAFGNWAGFSNGWVYWSSEMLIMGSQLTALGIFTKFWFSNVPLWVFATIYGALGIIVILTGVNGFERFENIFAVVKIAAIVMFILVAGAAIFGFLGGEKEKVAFTFDYGGIMPNGLKGAWTAFIYTFYAFGGIEVMGIMANELKDPKQAPKAGKIMLMVLTVIYLLSLILAIFLVPIDRFSTDESPFIIALEKYDLSFVPHVFNGALVIAGFSTMTASLYAITTMIVTLAKDGDAPAFFAKVGKRNLPVHALGLTVSGLLLSIIVSLLLPERIYEYMTTAAGLMLLYTWLFILFSYKQLTKLSTFQHIKRYVGTLLILAAVGGTLVDGSSKPGFFVSLLFVVLIGVITFLMRKKWEKV
ncbi:amino acid permease [Aquibacillus sp. 3ASR75-11]|uniref:Amino acid permease n=1 Tax=Terrihalobacillus insolitus TaxID=2950438 RepID=A0A9X4AMU5_9BACI|nr:amino acid permease [Terrihalobacillus insolitus]MDC3413235.1 amino acid permease [Terrihalobacillus insolitus]MDC3425711.1 amino acid permease [Terrihalobacillus insolitus]